ncbi:MAG: molybdopterin molybdotransferase MoeA [Spirosomataceae bacterium]
MISTNEADRHILSTRIKLKTEQIPFQKSAGRILAEPIQTDRDLPPFHRVTMDGVAVSFEGFKPDKPFFLEKTIRAGEPQTTLTNPNHGIEIMTGAMLPIGADTVIRYEDIMIDGRIAYCKKEAVVQKGQNIHLQGSDLKKGDTIAAVHKYIHPAMLGAFASVGKTHVTVFTQPKVLIISTGDEIISVEKQPLPHQIRSSNSYAIEAALLPWTQQIEHLHLPDDDVLIDKILKKKLPLFDCIILSGGVSAGKFDHIPIALGRLGVQTLFHKVTQKPGKPFWFGRKTDASNRILQVVFALPGNPASTFLCVHRYVIPWFKQNYQLENKAEWAILKEDIASPIPLTHFVQVSLAYNEATHQLEASPVFGNGSGDLVSLVHIDGFIELPANENTFAKGTAIRLWRTRI